MVLLTGVLAKASSEQLVRSVVAAPVVEQIAGAQVPEATKDEERLERLVLEALAPTSRRRRRRRAILG